MPFSDLISNKILDHFTGKATWTAPVAIYVGVSSTLPTLTGTNVTEPTTGSYVRKVILATQFTSAATHATETNVDISFVTATADWVAGSNLGYLVIYDAITAGNFLGFKALTVPKPCLNGDTFKITSGDLDISIGGT